MSKISELKVNESKKHLEAKEKLFRLILNNDVKLIDQFGIVANTWDYQFMAMESYVFVQMDKHMCPYHYGGSCSMWCHELQITDLADELGMDLDECADYMFDNQFEQDEFNKICINNEPYKNVFTSHPCSICKYKDKLDCMLIFDIGLARKGSYYIAIEVVNTSYIKENKLKICQENEITLLEVEADDILNYDKTSESLECTRYWWRTINGKVI